MKRDLVTKLAITGATAAFAFGAVGCEVDDAVMDDPGLEDTDLFEDEDL